MKRLGAFEARDVDFLGKYWELSCAVNGYAGPLGNELGTQAASGRGFQLIDSSSQSFEKKTCSRFKVRLLEDGYHCWFELSEVIGRAFKRGPWEPNLLDRLVIQDRLPAVLQWVANASEKKNKYLWGGAIGPDFDCSGLIQAGFASQNIWLPRDAYQQESFCTSIKFSPENYQVLQPGDLLFFGTFKRCTHVGLYQGEGWYWHSSGLQDGRNGIGCDCIDHKDLSPIASHYRSCLRGAGRVAQCHDGTTLL